jgi:hypothetical protein
MCADGAVSFDIKHYPPAGHRGFSATNADTVLRIKGTYEV